MSNIPDVAVDVVFDRTNKDGRILTLRVVMNQSAEDAAMRASGVSLRQTLPQVFADELQGGIFAMIDKGLHGMQADELAANGSIEIGRPSVS